MGACTRWEPARGGSLHETVFSSALVQLKQNFDTTRLDKFPSKSLLSLNEWSWRRDDSC